MRIRIFETPHDAGIYGAALAERTILKKEHPVLGLATGSTPIPFYQSLIQLHQCGLDLSKVTTINLDEYIGLDATHEQSYRTFMWENLFSKVNIQEQQIHLPNGQATDMEAECKRYDDIIREKSIDFQILGIGVNGHIGFNEPDHSLMSRTHVVRLTEETIKSNARFFNSIDEVPKKAITMGVQSILQAEEVVLMAFGEAKATIVEKMLNAEVTTDIPASLLKLHRNCTILLDKESARLLK